MKRPESRSYLKYIMTAAALFCLFAWVRVDAATVYTNGYFKYTVEDHSVTIVSYFGTENEVNVPNMIAGNPVNVIGKGAFARNKAVTMIFLPDTIMSVEEGAFSENQKVEYDDGSKGNDEGGQTNTQSKENMPQDPVEEEIKDPVKEEIKDPEKEEKKDPEKEEKKDPAENNGRLNVKGIPAGRNSIITVDDDSNLILVDEDGNETVIDDRGDYSVITDTDGNIVINDAAGNKVDVLREGVIEYTDKDKNRVKLDTNTGSKHVEAADGDHGFEEVQIDDDIMEEVKTEETSVDEEKVMQESADPGQAETEDIKHNDEHAAPESTKTESIEKNDFPVATVIVFVISILAVAYIVLFRQKKV